MTEKVILKIESYKDIMGELGFLRHELDRTKKLLTLKDEGVQEYIFETSNPYAFFSDCDKLKLVYDKDSIVSETAKECERLKEINHKLRKEIEAMPRTYSAELKSTPWLTDRTLIDASIGVLIGATVCLLAIFTS